MSLLHVSNLSQSVSFSDAVSAFASSETHTFPEIRTALETESGIQGITVPSISIDASPDVDGKALVAAGFTEKSGKFWLTDSEKITRWSEKTYGLVSVAVFYSTLKGGQALNRAMTGWLKPASLPSDAPFDPSHLLKIGFILRPVTDLFLPPGEAREYMTKKKVSKRRCAPVLNQCGSLTSRLSSDLLLPGRISSSPRKSLKLRPPP